MAFYSYIFSANYKGFKDKLKKIAKKENKRYLVLLCDTYLSIIKYGIGLTDYLNYEFYKKNKTERKTYAGIKIQDYFYERVSPSAYKKRYTIKPDFLADFKKYTKRDFIVPEKSSLKDFKKYISTHEVFMSKPYDGLGGAEVEKKYSKDIKNIEEFYNYCQKNRIFLEDVVKQHKEMNRMCAASCNTIRIMTFNNNGKPEILWAGLRIGNGINSVDNFHAKGMATEIDLETGKLVRPALDKDLQEYTHHPTSGVEIEGFQIPYFDEVKKMVKEASLESDKILVVGWDVAITDEGPIIIEGNRRPGFDVVQVASRRGRIDIINHVLECIDNNDKK
ncbi:MAG: sugar-transfer associated ATP-grasp domain-containing protein [Bacilli bacterium]